MHLFHVVTVFTLLTMVGVEFSLSAFVNPNAWRLEPASQAVLLSPLARLLGRVMPPWYAAGLVLLLIEAWLHRHTAALGLVLTASALWLAAVLGSIFLLVPLNNRVIAAAPGWQASHHAWDRRHRVRILVLAVAAALLTSVVVA